MLRTILIASLLLGASATAASAQSSTWGPGADDAAFEAMIRSSFAGRGIATLDRLAQDETQAFCSDPEAVMAPDGAQRAAAIEAANMATVQFPADGNWLGDWQRGERIAQSGRGLTWSDAPDVVNGGNCYNCHQIGPDEISYGTIGPSLLGYGKMRGQSEEEYRYAWAKIWNSKASNACSNMPRAGAMGILNADQVRDIMALLFDPASPVNR